MSEQEIIRAIGLDIANAGAVFILGRDGWEVIKENDKVEQRTRQVVDRLVPRVDDRGSPVLDIDGKPSMTEVFKDEPYTHEWGGAHWRGASVGYEGAVAAYLSYIGRLPDKYLIADEPPKEA